MEDKVLIVAIEDTRPIKVTLQDVVTILEKAVEENNTIVKSAVGDNVPEQTSVEDITPVKAVAQDTVPIKL